MPARIVLLATLVSAALFCAEPQPADDPTLIVKTDGTKIPVLKIVRDDYLYVVGVTKGGGQVKVPSHAVKDILYADRDANYSTALERRDEGRFTLAALYFTKALEAMPDRTWAPEYCNQGIASALFAAEHLAGYHGQQNEYEPPAVYFGKVLQANPKSRFLPEIAPKLALCLMGEGKDAEAAAALKQAGEVIRKYRDEAVRVDGGFARIADRAQAELAIAAAKLAQNAAAKGAPWSDARDAWFTARRLSLPFRVLYAQAASGLLDTLLSMHQPAEAKAEAASIIEKFGRDPSGENAAVLAAAYVALGRVHLSEADADAQKGRKIQAQAAYAEARWNFLHVVAACIDGAECEAEAHYYAGVCYDRLRDLEGDAAQKAVREWRLVVQNFPRSPFKDAAAQELARAK
jgi:tetratricopeptide (TPR) repeat protein